LISRVTGQLTSWRSIWDRAPHNAFCDLTRHRDRWWLALREASDHMSRDGVLRLLTSEDGKEWRDGGLLVANRWDLRDPHFIIDPAGDLSLLAGAWSPGGTESWIWHYNGHGWSVASMTGIRERWLWRGQWHRDRLWGVAYRARAQVAELWCSRDGVQFTCHQPDLLSRWSHRLGYPNEATLLFTADDTAWCLIRRDADTATAQLGQSRPPYRDWQWRDLGIRLGGPHWLQDPHGRIWVAARRYRPTLATALYTLDLASATLQWVAVLPSAGDCGYPGLVWHQEQLTIAWYSSHTGKSAIYLGHFRPDGDDHPPCPATRYQ
jgi:hypothetical protein